MKTTISLVIGLTFPGAVLAESPTFEKDGFPLTLHQAQVTALPDVREWVPIPPPEQTGIPVSPVQMLVLTPRQFAQKPEVIDRVPGEIRGRWVLPVSAPNR